MNEKIIYTTKNFKVCVPRKPHVSREDGGHLVIKTRINNYENRWDLSINEAVEVMRLTMLVGEAMIKGMKKRGIIIDRINYQDNSNWSFLNGEKPHFHVQLYGRTRDSKVQPFGEAIYLPNPDTDFYDDFKQIDAEDIKSIQDEIKILEKSDKYLTKNWDIDL